MIAPNIAFAHIHNLKQHGSGVEKKVAIPVAIDNADGVSGSITKVTGPLEDVMNENHCNIGDITTILNPAEVMTVFNRVTESPRNPFSVDNDGSSEEERRDDLKLFLSNLVPVSPEYQRSGEETDHVGSERSEPHDLESWGSQSSSFLLTGQHQKEMGEKHPGDESQPEAQRSGDDAGPEDLSKDPVERSRSKLPHVSSVFLPDSERISSGVTFPVNFLDTRHPYVRTMPTFFPKGLEGLHDPDRQIQPTELEFVLHYLRNVRKDLSENFDFVALAALRLETSKVQQCLNALRGYTVGESAELIVPEDVRFRFMHLPGSHDYLMKQRLDIMAKSTTLKNPQLFYTFTCTDRWEVVLASCLSQEGMDVWNTRDEEEMLTLLPSCQAPTDHSGEYALHRPSLNSPTCPYHDACDRVMVSDYFVGDEEGERDLLCRNIYTVNRIFDHKVRRVMKTVLRSELKVEAYHDIKEFGDASGWAHVHGVAWRGTNGTEDIFSKMHQIDGTEEVFSRMHLDELEKVEITKLVQTLISVSLSPDRIAKAFPDLSGPRSELIASLARRLQIHDCTSKCLKSHVEAETEADVADDAESGVEANAEADAEAYTEASAQTDSEADAEADAKSFCWYRFPHLPSSATILASPPLKDVLGEEVAEQLICQADNVKVSVKKVLKEIREEDELESTSLEALLLRAIGRVVETVDGFSWKDGFFPHTHSYRYDNHCLNFWRVDLLEKFDYPDRNVLNLLAMYHASLAISENGFYEIVHERRVDEAWVVEYNPHCLEEMRSNMAIKLITKTPQKVVNYITKGSGRKFHDYENGSLQSVVKCLEEKNDDVGESLVRRVKQMVEVCQAEALFRIDPNLSMSNTNVAVTWVNTSFPRERGAVYARVEEDGEELPDRVGEFVRMSRIEDRYQRK